MDDDEGGWQPVGPSALAWDDKNFRVPRELGVDEIDEVVRDFARAAIRAERAGFDVIELHAAHGYLIHSFLSPLSNRRQDAYGGDFDGRVRLCLEVVRAIRHVWPRKPLFVRLSCTDWVDSTESWDLDQTLRLAALLKELHVDVIDCSSGKKARTRLGSLERAGAYH